jgi:hypothetical protein
LEIWVNLPCRCFEFDFIEVNSGVARLIWVICTAPGQDKVWEIMEVTTYYFGFFIAGFGSGYSKKEVYSGLTQVPDGLGILPLCLPDAVELDVEPLPDEVELGAEPLPDAVELGAEPPFERVGPETRVF